jgi:hypothetical protein
MNSSYEGPERVGIPDERNTEMSLFMDVHNIEGGVAAGDVADAHSADLATQGEFGVNYLRYWVDESAGKIFCLVDAPDAEAAAAVHEKAHGLVADEIYPVAEHA